MEMLKHALAVLVISAASATSVAAHADWNGAARYAPTRHVVVAPRYCTPVHPVPSAYYWSRAPHYAPYRYAPYGYYAPSNGGWRKVWRQQRFDHGPNYGWNNHGGYNHDGDNRGGNHGSNHGSWNNGRHNGWYKH
jgi:hypothetical protein